MTTPNDDSQTFRTAAEITGMDAYLTLVAAYWHVSADNSTAGRILLEARSTVGKQLSVPAWLDVTKLADAMRTRRFCDESLPNDIRHL